MATCGRVQARSRGWPGPLFILLLSALGPARADLGGAAAGGFVGMPQQQQQQAVAAAAAAGMGVLQQQQQQQAQPGPVGVGRGPRGASSSGAGGGWKLADEPVCREDVTRVCPKHSWANNLAVLECLQDVREVSLAERERKRNGAGLTV